MAADIPIKDFTTAQRSIGKVNVLGQLDFADESDRLFAVFNPADAELYAGVLDTSAGEFHLYKVPSRRGDDLKAVVENVNFGSADRISAPLVTHDGSLILSENGNEATWRFEAGAWDQDPTQVGNFAGLFIQHGQDNSGDIYIGEYFSASSDSTTDENIYKSSDDGQTWSIVYSSQHDKHMHGVTPSPENDVLCIAWGDSSKDLEFVAKDGTGAFTANALGPQDDDYQAIGAIPIGVTNSGPEQEEFITLSDASSYTLTRGRVNLGGTDYRQRYTVPSLEANVDVNPFVMDAAPTTTGGFIANGMQGIYYSPDGWLWDKVVYNTSAKEGTGWEQAIAEVPGGFVIPVGSELWYLPSDVISGWTVDKTHYVIANGSVSDTTGNLMIGYPSWRYSSLRIAGQNGATGNALQLVKMSNPQDRSGNLAETFDFESGNKEWQRDLISGGIWIQGRTDLQSGAVIHVTVER